MWRHLPAITLLLERGAVVSHLFDTQLEYRRLLAACEDFRDVAPFLPEVIDLDAETEWAEDRAYYQGRAAEDDGGDWEAPVSFDDGALPVFPLAALPPWLGAFVDDLATATQTPPDLGGLLSLAVCAAALAKRVRVRVKDGWQEPVNLYVVVALPPASRKSAVFAEVAAPLEAYERQERDRLLPAIEAARAQRKVAEKAQAQAIERAAKAEGDDARRFTSEAEHHAQALAVLHVPAEPRLIASDVTPEKLATLLADQGGRLAVLSPEGGVFDIMAGHYAKSPHFEVLLKAHAGDDLRIDRVLRPAEYVHAPALTLGLAVQPDVVRALAAKPGFRGRGLLGRILYALPRSGLGKRKIDPPAMSESVRRDYHRRVLALLALPPTVDVDGRAAEHAMVLSPGARDELRTLEGWLEPRLGEFGELGAMGDWAGKLAGAVARVAGVLHAADLVGAALPWERPIPASTMARAVDLGRYLIPHAQAAYQLMGEDGRLDDARHLWRWIEREGVEHFTQREAYRATRGRFKTVDVLERGLAVLVERHFLREAREPHVSRPGRKPGPSYDVNPKARGGR